MRQIKKLIKAFNEKYGLEGRFEDALEVGGSEFKSEINFVESEVKNLLEKEIGWEGFLNITLVNGLQIMIPFY